MRIYDWASDVRDQWFIDDGIHFTSQGYAQRGKLIADALLTAFPADGDVDGGNSDNCLIDPDSKAIAEATKDNVPKKKRGGAADSTTDTETTPTTPTTPTTTTDPSVTG